MRRDAGYSALPAYWELHSPRRSATASQTMSAFSIGRREDASAGRMNHEACRLGHEPEVGADSARRAGECPDTIPLLVSDGVDEQVAAQLQPTCWSTSAASTIEATPPFMSQAPRP
jgi:hypothetical protein